MVDSNLHRERLLPSEKAFAYKMKLDAIKHRGKSLSQVATKSIPQQKSVRQWGKAGIWYSAISG